MLDYLCFIGLTVVSIHCFQFPQLWFYDVFHDWIILLRKGMVKLSETTPRFSGGQ